MSHLAQRDVARLEHVNHTNIGLSNHKNGYRSVLVPYVPRCPRDTAANTLASHSVFNSAVCLRCCPQRRRPHRKLGGGGVWSVAVGPSHAARCTLFRLAPVALPGPQPPVPHSQGKETADAASAARSTVTMDSFAAPPADAHLVYVIADAQ